MTDDAIPSADDDAVISVASSEGNVFAATGAGPAPEAAGFNQRAVTTQIVARASLAGPPVHDARSAPARRAPSRPQVSDPNDRHAERSTETVAAAAAGSAVRRPAGRTAALAVAALVVVGAVGAGALVGRGDSKRAVDTVGDTVGDTAGDTDSLDGALTELQRAVGDGDVTAARGRVDATSAGPRAARRAARHASEDAPAAGERSATARCSPCHRYGVWTERGVT
jgi:hypothetical protein